MADLASLLSVLEHDPDDAQALAALVTAARATAPDVRASRFAAARKVLAGRGRPDALVQLLDIELGSTGDPELKIDLLLEKGMVLDGDLLDVSAARAAFEEVRRIRPEDPMAQEALGEIELAASNWQKFADKYVKEARASTDRSLATGLFVSAAEAYVRFAPESREAEDYLRKALEIDPRNGKAAFHLARLLRRAERWADLAALLEQRAELAPSTEEKVTALLSLADLARAHGGADGPARADAAVRRVLQLDPAHPQALRAISDALAAAGDWRALVATYQAALGARREADEMGMLLQIGMVLWRHLEDLDQAEEYFRRIRKLDPAHPAALDFYRAYYPSKGESGKLIALLRSVEKSPRARAESQRPIGVEIAELAEAQHNHEKAIEAWKQVLRQEPSTLPPELAEQARAALARLYRKTEKWNALLDLMKEEADRLPEDDVAGRVAKQLEIVEIYRDRLRLDVMVINTYNAILKIDPDNRRANDELAAKFRALSRWNDLIAVLTRKSEAPDLAPDERVALLREIADLWAERFGNFANAIKPLERILELAPGDDNALTRLKEIYTKRRQWRALIDVLGREASVLPEPEKRVKQGEMARLAAERLGDTRLAIELHNRVLGEAGADHPETLAALASLYEREKRWLPLAEILHREIAAVVAAGDRVKEAVGLLEKLGQLYADRLGAPQAAAEVWQQILDLEPGHAKALRTLRELYATAGDFAGLEKLYARLGQEDELVDALLAIADRLDGKAQRLPLVERAAQLAQLRADAAAAAGDNGPTGASEAGGGSSGGGRRRRGERDGSPAEQALERARQVWERVLAVDPAHTGAATALAPIYAKQEKWSRLITVLEIELGAAADAPARLAKIAQIRELCEQRLASRSLAFTWTARAFELDPASEALFADLLRLASEPEQWAEVAALFDRQAGGVSDEVELRLVRGLARIASRRLGDPDRARGYHRRVLELAPDDRDAEAQLEELAGQLADWPELLASYRRRAARALDAGARARLLLQVAALQEEKLVDLDGAAETYREALMVQPGHLPGLRALARLEEARGDFEALADVLAAELEVLATTGADPQLRFELMMRIGLLEEQALERPARAIGYYRSALVLPAADGAVRPQAVAAMARFLPAQGPGGEIEPGERVAVARLVLPHFEAARNAALQALALEVIRTGADTSAAERLDLDRQLARLYHAELGDPAAAWTPGCACSRPIRATPACAARSRARRAARARRPVGRAARHRARRAARARGGARRDPRGRHRARGGRVRAARRSGHRERAWLTVLEVEPDAPDAFDALTAAYRAASRWDDLRALLERRAEVALDERIRLAVLLELAALEEDVLGRAERAIAAHRRILELDPGHAGSFHALDRLYQAGERWDALEELLARQADHASAPRELIDLAYRRAELFAHRLGQPARAVDLLEDVIARQRGHADGRELLEELLARDEVALRVARLLEPLYDHDKLWKDLVTVLRVQRRLVDDVARATEAVELLVRIAALEEGELGGVGNAFGAWLEVLRLDPAYERARAEIVRLAQLLGRWPEATAALEAAVEAAPDGDVATRGALLGELAAYYDTQLGDAPRAITAYARLLELDASNPATVHRAGGALARLYEAAQDWPALRAVTRRRAEWTEDAQDRRLLLARVAQLEEDRLGDRAAAIATWRDVLADHPTDPAALDALERLYQGAEQWRELVEVLRRKLDHTVLDTRASMPALGTGTVREVLARIAEIHEVMLEEPEEAIAAHLEILDRDGRDRHALAELTRLYREGGRHADLLDVLERQAALDPEGRLALQVEIALLLAGPLGRAIEALERWAAVLEVEPEHPQALASVESSLADPDLRVMAADMLRPVYERGGQYERLAQLQLRASEWAEEPGARLRALAEVVRLREHRLGDKAGAFAAQLVALAHAATEPELAQVVADTERLAGAPGREADLIDAYRDVAPDVLDAEIQRRLYLDVADLSRAVRRDLVLAREYYQKVLDAQPDDRRALAALESIYRETNDDERLTEVLLRQADAASTDTEDRVGALVEAAGLYATLGRPDDAIATWEQVLAVAPERRDAVDALEELYRAQDRWPDVVDLYERRLGFATTIDEAVALRVQLGEIHERHLRDFETAIDNFAAALSGDPRNAIAVVAVERYLNDPDLRVVAAEVLEPIYVTQSRWSDLIRVYEARLESTTEPIDRLKLTRYVARLYEEQLEDFENASHWYARVFREQPSDPAIRDQLQRLASIVDNWGYVASVYQHFLDDEHGESPEIRDVAIAAAAIYDRRLHDVPRAFAVYRRALAIVIDGVAPSERELLRRIEEMLERAHRWEELVAIYEDVIARADDDLRREALIKRARLLEAGIEDTARAIDGWREVVATAESEASPAGHAAYAEAVGELERLYRLRNQWHDLVELFEARLARAQRPLEIADLRLGLAELLEGQLADLPAAIDQYEHVIGERPAPGSESAARWERAVAALERLVVHHTHRERIAELLEPVYRAEDWWQKLVVILDAKLAYVRDPADQVATLHEIARIHEERGGALDLALEALARAWHLDVAEPDSLDRLLALAAKLGAWDMAATTIEEGAAAAAAGASPDLGPDLWARAAQLHELQRGDLDRAIDAWRKVDDGRPDDPHALAALDRLLARCDRVAELVVVVARRAELAEDAGVRLVLLHRVASLYEGVLGDRDAAIAAYKEVLGVDDADATALDALERLYRAAIADAGGVSVGGAARELVQVLERKIELTAELAARQALRHAAAQVHEHQLGDIYQAMGQLTAVLDDDAGDHAALGELDRIYGNERMWAELLDVVDRRALLAADARARADLAYRAAHLVEVELVDPEAAIPRYGAVLTVLPAHPAARAALEALLAKDHHVEAVAPLLEQRYRADGDAAGLVRVYERRLATGAHPDGDARGTWTALADVHEIMTGDVAAAFGVWSRAIAAEPEAADLLVPLQRLAEQQPALWAELAARLDQLLVEALPPDVEQAYAMRLGQIAEDRLADLERAARAFERATTGPAPREALTALERVLARSSRWEALAGVLRRQADASDDDAHTAEYLYREGDLRETTLHDPRAAIASYREVLAIAPEHPAARAALDRMLHGHPALPADQRAEIVEILEPLFEQDGDASRLAATLEARLELTEDPIDRAGLPARIVELVEERLDDRRRALDAALRWLAVDPASAQALGEVDRLAARLGDWPDVAARVADIVRAPASGARDVPPRDPEVQVALLTFLGRVQRERLGQLDEAAASYRAALALEPDGAAALTALDELITILRQRDDGPALAEALRRRGRTVSDVPAQRAAFAEVAALCERAGDRAGAIAAWREVTEIDDTDRGALDELARIYRGAGGPAADVPELLDTLARGARLATSASDEKRLRVEIAAPEADSPRAVGAWQAVLDLEPDDLAALAALEAAYGRAGDWVAVGDVQNRRLALAGGRAEQLAIYAEIARVAETKRGSIDDAIATWYAALDVDAAYEPAHAELDRLLRGAARWHDLVELLERRAEQLAIAGDLAGELAMFAYAADVWEDKLDNPDAAGEILEKILAREPDSVGALTRLSKIYERAGDWDRCKQTLEQALRALGDRPEGRDAADLFFRLGEVARVGDGDVETAILHFQQALRHEASHPGAVGALEKLARERRDATLLADMLQRRVATVTLPAERVALFVEIAELERKAGRHDAALVALKWAADDAPGDLRVLAPLADLYFAAGKLDEAAPIYDKLAEEAKANRRMKDVARFRQRQGGIYEARGDRAAALAAYEEAMRVNPTDVTTMTGLGRLYLAAQDWEKARKVYQSLVLQNLDADAGITKGEIYLALGQILVQLGQAPKAKSMFQRGLELEPNNAQLKEALARA